MCEVEVFEKLRATLDLERCGELLHDVEELSKPSHESGSDDKHLETVLHLSTPRSQVGAYPSLVMMFDLHPSFLDKPRILFRLHYSTARRWSTPCVIYVSCQIHFGFAYTIACGT